MSDARTSEVFVANPITEIGDDDLIYVSEAGSPRADAAIKGSDLRAAFAAQFAPLANVPVAVSGTTDTLDSDDLGKINRYTNSSEVTVTLPTDASDDLADGFSCTLVAEGAGGLTLDVTGITVTGSANTTIAQGEAMVVVKTATANTWVVIGGTS